jgi:hypothetical protein
MAVDTELWDDDALWELSAKERQRVKNAMLWGRPLPSRLASVAVQHAPTLQGQAWYGWVLIGLGLAFGGSAAVSVGSSGWLLRVAGVLLAVVGAAWLLLGVVWLRAVVRARQVAGTGYWPERAEP